MGTAGRNRPPEPAPEGGFAPWAEAWQRALYGPAGFYRRGEGPAAHFRTGVHASRLLAAALGRLAGSCGLRRVVDLGAGRGELLRALAECHPALDLVGVDVVRRPDGLPERCGWLESPGGAALPDAADLVTTCCGALVLAHEWLDVVPCPVVEVDDDGVVRVVEVDPEGGERLGPPAAAALPADDLAWLGTWWPLAGASPGSRAEVGRTRDGAWAALVGTAPDAVLLAVDYVHEAGHRPPLGSLSGFRAGRAVRPVPDGRSDLTAHVAVDALAASGRAAGAVASRLLRQRDALVALGVHGARPPIADAGADPRAYLLALQRAGEAAELLDPGGLGGFGWLLQSTGPALPDPFQ